MPLAPQSSVTTSSVATPSGKPTVRNRPVLFAIAGPHQGAVFPLHGTSISIGRGSRVDVDLEDDAVSARHAHVTRRSDGMFLQDGHSSHGTFLNGERIHTPCPLVDGDHVRVGNTILRFSMLDELEEHALTQLFELTIHDPLTHAYNRRYLTTHLRHELSYAARQNQSIGLLLIDIDHFKRVNDSYGHRVGDVVLQLVAASIQRTLRPYDALCRYGGEEFVVVARDISLRNAEILAERVRHNIEAMRIDGASASASVTVSIGVTSTRATGDAGEAEHLLQLVDEALYAAKGAGRNRVKVAQEAPSAPTRRTRPPHTLPPRP
jgi:diguanylate cyclase (GGDEF)-like protein